MSSKRPGILKRLYRAIAKGLQNSPTILKIILYMLPLYILILMAADFIYLLPPDVAGIIFWAAIFYVFIGFQVSLRSYSREKIINEGFSLNTMFALNIGALIWFRLNKTKKQ